MAMLSDDDILQSNSGGFNAGSGSATLAATTAGTTVVIVAFTYGTTITTPTGFTRDSPDPGVNSQALYVFRKSNVGASETTWTLTLGASAPCAWVAYEITGLDLTAPLLASSPYTTASAQSVGTGSTQQQASYDMIYLAAHGGYDSTSATPPTWSGHTSSFTELHDQGAAGSGVSVGLSVSRLWVRSVAQYSCTATSSLAAAGPLAGLIVGYAAAGSKKVSDVLFHTGLEWGLDAGLNAGTSAARLFGNISGSPAIVTTTPRSGAYCLECSATSATEWVSIPPFTTNDLVVRLPFRFPGSLPAGNVQLCTFVAGTVVGQVGFRASDSKITAQVGAGTTQVSAGTVAADTWHTLDLRFTTTATDYTLDWQVDGVEQAQAVSGGETAGSAITTFRIGWNTAATATIRYDDMVASTVRDNYPLSDHTVVLLKVDPSGTLTVNGSTANFNTFTANGTLAAWDATTARGAIDELPPTVGGSADGIAVVAASTTAYVEVPMETYTAAADKTIRAVRMIARGWAASDPAAATIKFVGWEGSEAVTLQSEADPGFNNSSTPSWVARMFAPTGGWTQAKLDALAFRMYSNDATPNIGIHTVYAEVLLAIAQTEVLFGEPGNVYVEAKRDPITNGIVSFTVTTPVGRGATVNYEVNGVPDTTGFIAANSTHTEILNAADFPTINLITLVPG